MPSEKLIQNVKVYFFLILHAITKTNNCSFVHTIFWVGILGTVEA